LVQLARSVDTGGISFELVLARSFITLSQQTSTNPAEKRRIRRLSG
jgi:hypothetical protein